MNRIEYLTHITSLHNLESILKRGLISPQDISDNEGYQKHVGDHYYNKTKNFVYMSMKTKIMKDHGLTSFNIRKGQVLIMIEPRILYDYNFILNSTWDEQDPEYIIDSTEYVNVAAESNFDRIIEGAEKANLEYGELPEFKFFGSIPDLKDYILGFQLIFNEYDSPSLINISRINSLELFTLDNKSIDNQEQVASYHDIYDTFNSIAYDLMEYSYIVQSLKIVRSDDFKLSVQSSPIELV
jgi:hypothetical protein